MLAVEFVLLSGACAKLAPILRRPGSEPPQSLGRSLPARERRRLVAIWRQLAPEEEALQLVGITTMVEAEACLPEEFSSASVQIMDACVGNRVRTEADGSQSAAPESVEWDTPTDGSLPGGLRAWLPRTLTPLTGAIELGVGWPTAEARFTRLLARFSATGELEAALQDIFDVESLQ